MERPGGEGRVLQGADGRAGRRSGGRRRRRGRGRGRRRRDNIEQGNKKSGAGGGVSRSYPFPSSSQLGHEDGGRGDVGLVQPLVAPYHGEADTIIKNKCS